MIRSKSVILIDSINRLNDVVYMGALKIKDSDLEPNVEFVNQFWVLRRFNEVREMPREVDETYCKTLDEEGNKIMDVRKVTFPFPAVVSVGVMVPALPNRIASYKRSTFLKRFPQLLTVEDYDAAMIQEIDELNKYEWPAEKTPIRFWDFTANDLEVVTAEMFSDLTKVEFINWVEPKTVNQ